MAHDDDTKSLFTELDEKAARHLEIERIKKLKQEHDQKEAEKAEKRKINPLL
jgi:hypothetical protein